MKKLLLLITALLLQGCLLPYEPEIEEGVSSFGSSANLSDVNLMNEDEVASVCEVSVTVGNTTIYAGYKNASADNKDAVVVCFKNGIRAWKIDNYETTGDDSTAYGLFYKGGDILYAVFSATGTQGDKSEDFRRFCEDGWLRSYSDASNGGGGPKVAVILKLSVSSGEGEYGTFLTAKKTSDGKINSLLVRDIDYVDNNLLIRVDSWYSPRNTDKEPISVSGSSPFDCEYEFSTDLQSVYSVTLLD